MIQKIKASLAAAGKLVASGAVVVGDVLASTTGTVAAVASVSVAKVAHEAVQNKYVGNMASTAVVSYSIVADQLSHKWTKDEEHPEGVSLEKLRKQTRDIAWQTYDERRLSQPVTEAPAQIGEPTQVVIATS